MVWPGGVLDATPPSPTNPDLTIVGVGKTWIRPRFRVSRLILADNHVPNLDQHARIRARLSAMLVHVRRVISWAHTSHAFAGRKRCKRRAVKPTTSMDIVATRYAAIYSPVESICALGRATRDFAVLARSPWLSGAIVVERFGPLPARKGGS
jgi:hypothetical protein